MDWKSLVQLAEEESEELMNCVTAKWVKHVLYMNCAEYILKIFLQIDQKFSQYIYIYEAFIRASR